MKSHNKFLAFSLSALLVAPGILQEVSAAEEENVEDEIVVVQDVEVKETSEKDEEAPEVKETSKKDEEAPEIEVEAETPSEKEEASPKEISDAEKAVSDAEKKEATRINRAIYNLPNAREITLDDEEAVNALRNAYEGLSEDGKKLVTSANLNNLSKREDRIDQLKEYKKAASKVEKAIYNLPKASELTVYDEPMIQEVRNAYDNLHEDAQAMVGTLYNLEAREVKLAQLKEDALTLARYKDAKVKIVSFLQNLTDEEKDAFASRIYVAEDTDAVDTILEEAFEANRDEDAMELARYKDEKVKVLGFLDNLTEEEMNDFASRIYVAEDTDAVDAIMDEAFKANQDEDALELARYKDAKVKIVSFLQNLTDEEKDAFASRIYVAEDKDAVDTILEEAFEANQDEDALALAKYKDEAVKQLNALENLTKKDKDAFASRIYVAEDTDAVDQILNEAIEANKDQELETAKVAAIEELKAAGITSDFYFNLINKANTIEGVEALKNAILDAMPDEEDESAKELELAKELAIAELKAEGITREYYFNLIRKANTVEGVEALKNAILDAMPDKDVEEPEEPNYDDVDEDLQLELADLTKEGIIVNLIKNKTGLSIEQQEALLEEVAEIVAGMSREPMEYVQDMIDEAELLLQLMKDLEESVKPDSIPLIPLEPSTPIEDEVPLTPLEPSTPIEDEKDEDKKDEDKKDEDKKDEDKKDEDKKDEDKKDEEKLPQTGEAENNAVFAGISAIIAGFGGLIGINRRKDYN